jgi:hypothetical protein
MSDPISSFTSVDYSTLNANEPKATQEELNFAKGASHLADAHTAAAGVSNPLDALLQTGNADTLFQYVGLSGSATLAQVSKTWNHEVNTKTALAQMTGRGHWARGTTRSRCGPTRAGEAAHLTVVLQHGFLPRVRSEDKETSSLILPKKGRSVRISPTLRSQPIDITSKVFPAPKGRSFPLNIAHPCNQTRPLVNPRGLQLSEHLLPKTTGALRW